MFARLLSVTFFSSLSKLAPSAAEHVRRAYAIEPFCKRIPLWGWNRHGTHLTKAYREWLHRQRPGYSLPSQRLLSKRLFWLAGTTVGCRGAHHCYRHSGHTAQHSSQRFVLLLVRPWLLGLVLTWANVP